MGDLTGEHVTPNQLWETIQVLKAAGLDAESVQLIRQLGSDDRDAVRQVVANMVATAEARNRSFGRGRMRGQTEPGVFGPQRWGLLPKELIESIWDRFPWRAAILYLPDPFLTSNLRHREASVHDTHCVFYLPSQQDVGIKKELSPEDFGCKLLSAICGTFAATVTAPNGFCVTPEDTGWHMVTATEAAKEWNRQSELADNPPINYERANTAVTLFAVALSQVMDFALNPPFLKDKTVFVLDPLNALKVDTKTNRVVSLPNEGENWDYQPDFWVAVERKRPEIRMWPTPMKLGPKPQ
ncbi:MAG: hypothetical protein NTZ65_00665 [Candidatus Berkelbacteria bacterium]|nr:hypothetical protein [Candidatus Berkelbacteria bacterium]